jgi:predicted DsbA family dithiol-disulfide isomerase
MNLVTVTPSTIVVLLLLAVNVMAQTPKSRAKPRRAPAKTQAVQPSPEPASTPATATIRPAQPPIPLAIVNGQTITTADIEQSVRNEVETLEDKIAAARKQILDLQINTILLDIEAKKRRLSSQQIYDAEVTKRIAAPTESEINDFISQNRDQLEPGDDLRLRVAALLKGEQEAKLSDVLVQKLRARTPVVMGEDTNTPDLSQTVIVATVAGQPITAGALNERLKPIIYKLRASAYERQKEAADKTVDDILLLAEANRRNIGPEEIIRTEVSQKIRTPTEADVSKFYSENRERIKGELDVVRNELALYLQDQEQRRLERALSERLRKGVNIRWLISEPEPPVQLVSPDDDPARGAANASVTVIEFTDFQCPACAAMQPVIDDVLKSYGDKVRFVVRDFPLAMHPDARKAAEAANAAHSQGKFFEYTALLFKRQKALDVGSLKKYASELGLDRIRFDAALDGGAYAAEVRHDVQDGEIYGVDSTPTIFVNGVRLRELSAESLRAAIDGALPKPATPSGKP